MISAYSIGELADLSEVLDLVAGCRDAYLYRGNKKIAAGLEQVVTKLNELLAQRSQEQVLTPEEQALVLDHKNIQAIKLVRERLVCSLKEAKDIVVNWRDVNTSAEGLFF